MLPRDINLFLNDIAGTDPAGEDLKYSALYDEIREHIREDIDLPQGVWEHDLKTANWSEVERMCSDILQNKSKDLQVASWLMEAWMYLYNMDGLAQGFTLLQKLSEKYWDRAFPTISLSDPEFRSAPFNWINEKLSYRFNKIKITAPLGPNQKAYNYESYIDLKKETSSEKKEMFDEVLRSTPAVFFSELKESGARALKIVSDLQNFLDGKMGQDAPSLYKAKERLEAFVAFSDQALNVQQEGVEKIQKEQSSEDSVTKPTPDAHDHIDMIMASRSDAYALINKAVDYLEKLDPHSPSPHLIKRAIRWSQLDLKDLLQEMVKDSSALADLKHLLGMKGDETMNSNTKGEA